MSVDGVFPLAAFDPAVLMDTSVLGNAAVARVNRHRVLAACRPLPLFLQAPRIRFRPGALRNGASSLLCARRLSTIALGLNGPTQHCLQNPLVLPFLSMASMLSSPAIPSPLSENVAQEGTPVDLHSFSNRNSDFRGHAVFKCWHFALNGPD